MKERPIIFAGESVRGILAGRKTQTRRLLRTPGSVPNYARFESVHKVGGQLYAAFKTPWARVVEAMGWKSDPTAADGREPWEFEISGVRHPHGAPGDRLWVRETWQPFWAPGRETAPASLATPDGWRIGYVATDGVREYHDPDDGLVARCKSPLHMPRWASRLTLEVVAVRVERLQSISEADAMAEGVDPNAPTSARINGEPGQVHCFGPTAARMTFAFLWDGINGKRAPWASNPWVWVVEFQRVGAP